MTIRARRWPVIAGVALVASLAARAFAAEESAGTRAASFLSGGSAPSVLAMGGATLALGRDLQGASANPAALGWVANPMASIAHASLADETSQEWFAAGTRLGSSRTRLGLSMLYRNEGAIEGRDEFDQPTFDVRAHDMALALQLARPVGERLAVGGSARWVDERIGDAYGRGFAFDAGAQLRMGALSFALAGQNFGGGMTWGREKWRMPASVGAGLAFEHAESGLRFALDLNAPSDYYRSLRAGTEWRWADRFALRGGWRTELGAPAGDHVAGLSFGSGVNVGPCWLDYGYVLAGDQGATHRVGLSLQRSPTRAEPPAPRALPASSGPDAPSRDR